MLYFVGSLIPDEEVAFFSKFKKGSLPESSFNHQRAIIECLKKNDKVMMINQMPCGQFLRRFKKIFVKGKHYDGFGYLLPSFNILIFDFFNYLFSFLKTFKNVYKEFPASTALFYMPFPAKSLCIKVLKKKYPQVKLVAIIPDLVQDSYFIGGSSLIRFFKSKIRKIQGKYVQRNLDYVDGFIYLTEKMRFKFDAEKPYIVQEAIYNINEKCNVSIKMPSCFTFTYCGKVSAENGIDRLLKAFTLEDFKHCVLNICGDGPLLQNLRKEYEGYSNIYFHGTISHEKVLEIERNSSVLVNPRYTYLNNTGYSFPSKVIEYLACAKPVISSKLDGIPQEYDEHLFYIEDDSAESLSSIMKKVANMSESELVKVGLQNHRFVVSEKSADSQSDKIANFLRSIG